MAGADGGEVRYRISLDTHDFTAGAQKASGAAEQLNRDIEQSSDTIDAYAQALNAKLAQAMNAAAQAQEQYDRVTQRTIQIQSELAEAQEKAIARAEQLEKRYKSKGISDTMDISSDAQYKQLMEQVLQLQEKLVAAQQDENSALSAVIISRERYNEVTAQAEQYARSIQQSVKDEARVEEQAAQATTNSANKQKQAAQEVQQIHKKASEERKKQLDEQEEKEKEVGDAAKKAAKEAADQQALAFGIAAKAVDEVVEGVKRLAQELLNLAKQVVTIGSSFEQSMAQVAATSGMTASDVANNISDYRDLVEAARTAGETTMFTATQAGEALNYLALAGYSVEESIATMPDILTIAAAGAMDLGRASDMVTDAMNALQMEVDETGEFIDKMAKTAQSSNTNVEQLGRAILTVGGTATVLKGGVTELDTALGLMANSGIKAQQGGTSLRQILLNLTDPTTKAAKKMEELGLNVFDMEGNMRSLQDIFQDLGTIMKDFTDQERMEALGEIFNARHIRAAVALMNASGEAWDELAGKIDNADGAAEKMADTMMSTFNGAIITAKSTLESIAITLNEGVRENLTALVREAIPMLRELNDTLASPEVQARLESMSAKLKEIALNVLDKIITAIPKVIDFLSNVDGNLKALEITLGVILSLKVASHITQILRAAQAFSMWIATNPYAALAVAIAGIVALYIQNKEAAEASYQAMVKTIEAENDAFKDQRSEIQGVIDEWNEYKETAGQITEKAEAQRDKVQALYEEYVKLYNAGEDTTLAMDALAQEIPELNEMLADGKTSFEDITKAVDNYCDALIRSADLEAGKEDYIQAVKTRNAIKNSLDDLAEAQSESEKAYREADRAYQDYYDKVYNQTDAVTMAQSEELDRLKADRDAKLNIWAADSKAYSDAKQAMLEADKQVEDSRATYEAAINESYKKEGKYASDRYDGAIKAGEAYAKDMSNLHKKQSAEQIEANKKYADEIDAGLADIERRINLGEADEWDKVNFLQNWFGTHEDWDRTDAELAKRYGNMRKTRDTLIKKENQEEERQAKERKAAQDKANKEREDAQKKSDAAFASMVKEDISNIEWFADYGDWSTEEKLAAYKQHYKTYEGYYQQHADKQEEITRKMAELEKSINTEKTKDAKKAAEEYVKNWTKGYDELIDKAEKAYAQLEKDADKYRSNLLKGTEITAKETKKVWDYTTHAYKDETTEGIISAKELREGTKQMEKVSQFIDQLKAQGADDSIITQLMGMDSEAQAEWMKQWNKMSAGQQQEWLNAWNQRQERATELSDKYFSDNLTKWEQDYWQPLEEYAATGGDELKKAMELAGQDSVQGWLDGVQKKYDEATGMTEIMYSDVLQSAKKALGIASPSKEFYAIGEFSIEGFLEGIQSKVDQISTIFTNLGQTAGDKFINAFKSTWDSFVTLLNNTGGLQIPVGMTTTTFGTPMVQGSQVYYTGTGTSYSGLTKADVTSAIKEAVPDGDVVLKVGEAELGRISRNSLNLIAEQSGTMDLRV